MPRFFVPKEQITEEYISIVGEDAKHIQKVLRCRIGEEVLVCDGHGKDYICEISGFLEKEVLLRQKESFPCAAEPSVKITLFQGLPKADKMELIIQKCVELGIEKIVPVATERSIVKLDKKESKKIERWQKIAEAAAKQSGRGKIPEIGEKVLSWQEALAAAIILDGVIVPYEKEEIRSLKQFARGFQGKSVGVFIGPEGGFTSEEVEQAIEKGILPVTLGKRILRTETAGMAVTAMLLYEWEADL